MASVIKDPGGRSPYWIAVCSVTVEGKTKRIWRTTKVPIEPIPKATLPDDTVVKDLKPDGTPMTKRYLREEAHRVAQQIERAIRIEHKGEATEANLRRILSETLERAEGHPLAHPSVADWLNQWIDSRTGAIAERTRLKYFQVRSDFLKFLGTRSTQKLEAIGFKDFLEFRKQLVAEGRTPQTADQLVRKILASPFTLAVKLGMLSSNPLAHLPPLRSTRATKKTFTPEQITKLVAAAKGDWKGMILGGYYTGARLIDLAKLRWSNLDLVEKTISFTQKKREGRSGQTDVRIPIHPTLEEYLLSLPSQDDASAPLFPELYHKPGTGRSRLSMAFKRIMEKAGIDAGVLRERNGEKGRSLSALSFHSLRHSFNSAMANAGVPQELRAMLTGHSSAEMNKVYTHHEWARLQKAVESIERLPGK
jgi:integrase